MMFEDAQDMFKLHSISPELTCECDELHICQQCCEEEKAEDIADVHRRAEEYLKPGGILSYQRENYD